MNSFNIRIANHVLKIESPFKVSKDFFVDFLTNDPSEISIELLEDDIIEKKRVYGNSSNPLGWEGRIDISLVLQRIADELVSYNTILMHGAAIAINNTGFLFIAPSGTGKTTHIRKWLQNRSDVVVVNGDKPFIIMDTDNSPLLCGSPWAGKEEMYSDEIIPLRAIITLIRSDDNRIERISFIDAFPSLLRQTYRPEDSNKLKKTLSLLQGMSSSVSFWRFYCNNYKDDCFDVSYSALAHLIDE